MIETHAFRLITTRQNIKLQRHSLTKCNLAESSLISLAAGAFAGSIGVGVAYPLDALKTKAQTYASSGGPSSGSLGLVGMTKLVFKEEGLKGFYGGVFGVMIGQGLIKAVAFGSNNWALANLADGVSPSLQILCIASAFSGAYIYIYIYVRI
jgi:hypothetical protein